MVANAPPRCICRTIIGRDELCHFLHRHGPGEAPVIAIAHRQLELFTAWQAHAVGLGPRMLAGRLARGIVARLHMGVYLWGGGTPVPGALELAGCLACPDSVASHGSAARLWGLVDAQSDVVHVTIAGRNFRTRPGLRIHRVTNLHAADVSDVRGIPVTSPARTLIDLAATSDICALRRALSEALARRLVTEGALRSALGRSAGRTGMPLSVTAPATRRFSRPATASCASRGAT